MMAGSIAGCVCVCVCVLCCIVCVSWYVTSLESKVSFHSPFNVAMVISQECSASFATTSSGAIRTLSMCPILVHADPLVQDLHSTVIPYLIANILPIEDNCIPRTSMAIYRSLRKKQNYQ